MLETAPLWTWPRQLLFPHSSVFLMDITENHSYHKSFFLNRGPSSVAPPCVKWKERFLRNLSSSLHLSCYLKTVFASRWVLEPKDTSKPNIRRRKDLLLAANKEKRGELSPKQGLSEQQN